MYNECKRIERKKGVQKVLNGKLTRDPQKFGRNEGQDSFSRRVATLFFFVSLPLLPTSTRRKPKDELAARPPALHSTLFCSCPQTFNGGRRDTVQHLLHSLPALFSLPSTKRKSRRDFQAATTSFNVFFGPSRLLFGGNHRRAVVGKRMWKHFEDY